VRLQWQDSEKETGVDVSDLKKEALGWMTCTTAGAKLEVRLRHYTRTCATTGFMLPVFATWSSDCGVTIGTTRSGEETAGIGAIHECGPVSGHPEALPVPAPDW